MVAEVAGVENWKVSRLTGAECEGIQDWECRWRAEIWSLEKRRCEKDVEDASYGAEHRKCRGWERVRKNAGKKQTRG